MEDYKNNIVDIINKAKEEIISLRDDLASNKEDVEEIRDIINRLKNIEAALVPKKKWFKQRIERLEDTLEELSNIRFDIMLNDTNKMFETIDNNLIDGMELEDVENNNLLKNLVFNGVKVGSVEVLQDYKPEIRIKVTVYENWEEFDVHQTLRMYSIISFINTKFNTSVV